MGSVHAEAGQEMKLEPFDDGIPAKVKMAVLDRERIIEMRSQGMDVDEKMMARIAASMDGHMAFAKWMQKKVTFPHPRTLMDLYKPMKLTKFRSTTGKFVIERPRFQKVDVVDNRFSILAGVKATTVSFPGPVRWHRLKSKHGCMTSDIPLEMYTQYVSFRNMYGHVLVGGLGLGMAAEIILDFPNVKSVTVIEKEKELIDLVKPQISKAIRIVEADLFEFVRDEELMRRFDSAYYDIWYGTGEATWHADVMPLVRATRQMGIEEIGAWFEYAMWGQLFPMLYTCKRIGIEHKWAPYKRFLTNTPKTMTDAKLVSAIDLYLTQIGSPAWEKRFGKFIDDDEGDDVRMCDTSQVEA